MTEEKGSSQLSSFLEPMFNRAVSLALIAIVVFLVIYVITIERRFSQNASSMDANQVRMAELSDGFRKAATSEQVAVLATAASVTEQADKLAVLEGRVSQQVAVMTQQIEGLNQQTATITANNETLQAEEMAQGKQIADIQERLVSLSGRADEFANADDASVEDLDALAAQLDTFATHDDLAVLESQMGTFASAEDEADQDAQPIWRSRSPTATITADLARKQIADIQERPERASRRIRPMTRVWKTWMLAPVYR